MRKQTRLSICNEEMSKQRGTIGNVLISNWDRVLKYDIKGLILSLDFLWESNIGQLSRLAIMNFKYQRPRTEQRTEE